MTLILLLLYNVENIKRWAEKLSYNCHPLVFRKFLSVKITRVKMHFALDNTSSSSLHEHEQLHGLIKKKDKELFAY